MSSKLAGGCACGAVTFDCDPPSLWCAHCHCSMCRRAHGAAFVTWVGLAEARARVHDPQQTLRWYASSPGAERGFCSACGSPLFFRSQRWPGELHVARAQFSGAIDREPAAHVFWDTAVEWFPFEDGLEKKV